MHEGISIEGRLIRGLRRTWQRTSRWIPAFGLLAALVILGALGWRDRASLGAALRMAQPAWLAAAFGVFSVDLLLVITIWARLLQALGVTLPFWRHFTIYAQANAGKRLPGTLWYVASRVNLYEQHGVPAATIAAASGLEFALSFLTSAVFGLATVGDLLWTRVMPRVTTDVGLPFIIGIAAALVTTGVLVAAAGGRLIRRRLGESFDQHQLRITARVWIELALAYVGVWLCGGIFLLCIAYAFTPTLGFGEIRLTVGAWALSSMVATLALLLPSSLGVKEFTVGALLGAVLPASTAVLAAVLARLMTTAFDFAWSAAVMAAAKRRPTTDAG